MAVVAPGSCRYFFLWRQSVHQFSAAVADTGGSGGLIAELTGHLYNTWAGLSSMLVAVGLMLTWSDGV
jgi:hypothetical protein